MRWVLLLACLFFAGCMPQDDGKYPKYDQWGQASSGMNYGKPPPGFVNPAVPDLKPRGTKPDIEA